MVAALPLAIILKWLQMSPWIVSGSRRGLPNISNDICVMFLSGSIIPQVDFTIALTPFWNLPGALATPRGLIQAFRFYIYLYVSGTNSIQIFCQLYSGLVSFGSYITFRR